MPLSEPLYPIVQTVFIYRTGYIVVHGQDGQKIPHLQGQDTAIRRNTIRQHCTPSSQWFQETADNVGRSSAG